MYKKFIFNDGTNGRESKSSIFFKKEHVNRVINIVKMIKLNINISFNIRFKF